MRINRMSVSVAQWTKFDPTTGTIAGVPSVERRLSSLRGLFADAHAYEAALVAGDPVIYTVLSVEPAHGNGDLHYGLGTLQPGRIGDEYYMTKGHLHAWRPAAEVYIGLCGEGMLLLEDEHSGESRMLPLLPQRVVYVPGSTAHRTVNTGTVSLTYLGIYSALAGHDYGAIAQRNFRDVVVAVDGNPTRIDRETFAASLHTAPTTAQVQSTHRLADA